MQKYKIKVNWFIRINTFLWIVKFNIDNLHAVT